MTEIREELKKTSSFEQVKVMVTPEVADDIERIIDKSSIRWMLIGFASGMASMALLLSA